MQHRYDVTDPGQRDAGLAHAVSAARRGELIAVNVDGAYALITDAFSHAGVERIRTLRARPTMNVPVLVPRAETVDGLAWLTGDSDLAARTLMRDCWPGPLTLIARSQPSLPWACTPDGIVALRMPMHPWTLDIVRTLGPTATVPSNGPGQPPHADVDEVWAALGDVVSVYLDGGPTLPDQASTIVDVSEPTPRITREGAFTREYLATLVEGLR